MTRAEEEIFNDTYIAYNSWSTADLKRMYRIYSLLQNPILVKAGIKMLQLARKMHLPWEGYIRKTLFKQFCGGETLDECKSVIQKTGIFKIKTALNYASEYENVESDFDHNTDIILEALDYAGERKTRVPFCVVKLTGLVKASILEKLHNKVDLSQEEEQAHQRFRERMEKIGQKAYDKGVSLLIDSEESWLQKPVDDLALEMMKKYNQEKPVIYATFQMYLKGMINNLKKFHKQATMHRFFLGVKLVRGAYLKKEKQHARSKGYEDPVQPGKEATDNAFNEALKYCINQKERTYLALGSHNEYSNMYLSVLIQKHGLNPDDERFYFMHLYGMVDHISYNLANYNHNVAKYLPFGPIDKVMGYLMRRARENTKAFGQTSREVTLIGRELKRRKKLQTMG